MKIGVYAAHCGSSGLQPYGFGGGEAYTYALLSVLNKYYSVTALVPNGVYPGFDTAVEYGINLSRLDWKPVGDRMDWIRSFDVLININHNYMLPPVCRRNILLSFFPQYPEWETNGYDTVATISQFSAKWVKRFWGRDAVVIPPAIPVSEIVPYRSDDRGNDIVCVGRFFEVPGGNNKNHRIVLEAFSEIKKSIKDARLHLVGTILNQSYYDRIVAQANEIGGVQFHHDLNRHEYLSLLGRSRLVISATGYDAATPSSMEHFGIFAVEAMAVGSIPLVHASGGTPEVGAQVWETVPELVDVAVETLSNDEKYNYLVIKGNSYLERFSMESVARSLIGLIEMPVVVIGGQRNKIFESDDFDVKSIGMWVDSPGITTGFGLSTREIARRLSGKYDVSILGLQDPYFGKSRIDTRTIESILGEFKGDVVNKCQLMGRLRQIEPCPVWRGNQHDPGGWLNVENYLKTENPDALFLSYDIGNIRNMLNKLREIGGDAPLVALFPVEGSPVIPQYIETIRLLKIMNGVPLSYTKWGAEAIRKQGGPLVDYAHLGVDHANFRALDPEARTQLRQAVGWEGKTVVMTVGRNRRTKGLTTVIDVARIIKRLGHGSEFLFYIHTSPYDNISNSSLPLIDIAKIAGVDDMVIIPELHQLDGVPYDSPVIIGNVPDTDDIEKVRRINLSTLSMIERYGCADIYLNLSELEGFGLPAVEAQACGLPVVSVDDNGVQREVLGTAPIYIPVSHWDSSWHTGALLAQVNPHDAATALIDICRNDAILQELSEASLKNSTRFRWDNTVDIILSAIKEVI